MDWSSNSIYKACTTKSWSDLINTIHFNAKRKISLKGFTKFSELSQMEQSVVIEREFHEMQQSGSSSLTRFAETLNETIDNELLELVRQVNCRASNVDYLMKTCSEAIMTLMGTSPMELSACWVLFLNRPVPAVLRSYLWFSKLQIESRLKDAKNDILHQRLAPTLDVLFSRRCHLLLDNNYAEISSRSNAAMVRTIIVALMKKHNLSMPFNDETFLETDHLFFILVPLLTTLTPELLDCSDLSSITSSSSLYSEFCSFNEKSSRVGEVPGSSDPAPEKPGDKAEPVSPVLVVRCCMEALMDIGFIDILASVGVMATHSLYTNKTMELLFKKDSVLSADLQSLSDISEVRKSFSEKDKLDVDAMGLESGFSDNKYARHSGDEVDDSGEPIDKFAASSRYAIFSSFVDRCLMRGLSGLVNLEGIQFIWDQCFISGFQIMLPIFMVSLVLGCREQLTGLRNLSNVVDTFTCYCQSLTVIQIQRLVTIHCEVELKAIFSTQSTYRVHADVDGVFQAIWKEAVPTAYNASEELKNSLDGI